MSYEGEKSQAPKAKPNPFGAARPREQVIAERLGKNEKEILREQAQKDWKPNLVLTEAQNEEKKAAEAELSYLKSDLEKTTDEAKVKEIQDELAIKEKRFEELLQGFEKASVRPSGRRERRKEEQTGPGPVENAEYGNFNRGRGREQERQRYPEGQESYSNFSRNRGRENDRGDRGYGDGWSGKGRTGGQSQCYTCGEFGHFSRECPQNVNMRGGGVGGGVGGGGGGVGGGNGGGGSYGGYGGNRNRCYNCNEEGHFSRECPNGRNFGGGAGGGGAGYGGFSGGSFGGHEYHQDGAGYGYGGGAGGR